MSSESRDNGPILALIGLVLLILVSAGGGFLYLVTSRAQQQRDLAAIEAERARMSEIAYQEGREKLVRTRPERDVAEPRVNKADEQAASDALEALNNTFRVAYRGVREEAIAQTSPIIIVEGDELVLMHGGRRHAVTAVPRLYHELKAFAHVPLALYLMTRPGPDGNLIQASHAALADILAKIEATQSDLNNRNYPKEIRERQELILKASQAYVKDAQKSQRVAPEARSKFARHMAPFVLANATDAAKAQIDGYHKQVFTWRDELSPADWSKLKVVVMGTQMPRQGHIAVQYFAWLLGETGEGKRIVYAEAIFDEQKALALLATHRIDTDIGAAFFNDERRMHRDLLADSATEILKSLKRER